MARYLFCIPVTTYCLWLDQLFESLSLLIRPVFEQ